MLADARAYAGGSFISGGVHAGSNAERVRQDALQEKIIGPALGRLRNSKLIAKMVKTLREEHAKFVSAPTVKAETAPQRACRPGCSNWSSQSQTRLRLRASRTRRTRRRYRQSLADAPGIFIYAVRPRALGDRSICCPRCRQLVVHRRCAARPARAASHSSGIRHSMAQSSAH